MTRTAFCNRPNPRQIELRIADFLLDRVASNGACTDVELAEAGFSVAEVSRHGEAARRIALSHLDGTLRRPASVASPLSDRVPTYLHAVQPYDPCEPLRAAQAKGVPA